MGLKSETVVHEMVHQWFGNLVTCATWQDIWLNEGITVFVQRKMLPQNEYQGQAFFGGIVLQKEIGKLDG
jgi:aminopeptidase N